ncbi:MAG: PadR family transcriptional regulator [Actinomycetota bacterium]|nr:PadR family transcriptional regulator [Actinomycetota bacterium]
MTLTPTSFIVLGLLERVDEATPYDLKNLVAGSVGNFWSVPHSALYAEPERLAAGGYLTEHRETHGRRRKLYRLTASGREALRAWRNAPTDELPELRDLGLLKLFFGADVATLASRRLEAHRRKLAEYEARAGDGQDVQGPPLTLRAGLGHEREWVRFWGELAEGTAGDDGTVSR